MVYRAPVLLMFGGAAAGAIMLGSVLPSPTGGLLSPGARIIDAQAAQQETIDPLAPVTAAVTSPPKPQPALEINQVQPGQQPPQFIVMSFDGACEMPDKIYRQYLDAADAVDGRFSFNLSALCILPDDQRRDLYSPPQKTQGTSDIGFADPQMIPDRINTWAEAYEKGHEIATHYLGHFCGPNGVQKWSTADWNSEIEQFNSLLNTWHEVNPQVTGVAPLPFDTSVIKGGRTPCLEGDRDELYPAMIQAGYTYDSSNPGTLTWPTKVAGYDLWDFPLQAINLSGTSKKLLSMDYNFLANQNNGDKEAPEEKCREMEEQTYRSYMDAAEAVYHGNRAPLFVGSHFNNWACNAYTKANMRFVADIKEKYPDIQFISNADLVMWLEAQDPQILSELQARPVEKYES